ncbi:MULTISPECIES: 3-keto-5-aminohexanoate cleavage protein [unclassified Arthrobacter]|uniref:3-keto-5-aminohexanoate cleavage protein n=1 Tax=unclassified Arthrobacter TaxID=235627 RepID=UPI001D15077F|nr:MULTISPECIES: 3-keto-5-aminohexanoate cleavage protein [unclassified Arthrobacter]MCC3274538.1 3-keto-5-aminohexanoate cleavage protein [Arthrobacter sp. zg-Y20]MCC9177872.1 3-keto-5-aminohexanoate cleavage protein [Arthrobacter sp. zg-Y750]MDK1314695.1 3-keto-5-aminohexanoate cleavage protein [Arthrobacter sp. zg.Y20]WIB07674.1 3-keto-5-aminohexanoate cleavage protein [Arthrobacter sp. zg-Y20]
MRQAEKVIITTAVTGSVNIPSQSPHLPLSAEEVVASALGAAAAGSAVIHLHARHPDGRPAWEAEIYEEIVPAILDRADVVINITTGGSSAMTMEQRLAGALRFAPELASLNMGSMNFVYAGIADKVTDWKHDWEKEYVLNTYSHPFINSFDRIEHTLRTLGDGLGTRFEFECYDIGHLYSLAYFADMGLVKPPFLIQGVFGILGGIGADHENLTHMVTIADKLFGDDYYFSAFAAGRNQMQFGTHSAWLGGNVRVGLEDSLWINKGELAISNAQQVTKIRTVVEDLGKDIATPDDVRRMLNLKGIGKERHRRNEKVIAP